MAGAPARRAREPGGHVSLLPFEGDFEQNHRSFVHLSIPGAVLIPKELNDFAVSVTGILNFRSQYIPSSLMTGI